MKFLQVRIIKKHSNYIGTFPTYQNYGSWSLDLSGDNNGVISQEITTQPGSNYEITFYMSGNYLCGIIRFKRYSDI